MRLQQITHADSAEMRRLYDLYVAAERADDPDGPEESFEYFRNEVTYGWSGEPREIWMTADAAAGAWVEFPERDNRHGGGAALFVHPGHRRRGLGRALLAHLAERTRKRGRSLLVGDSRAGSAGDAFARAAGAELAGEDMRQVVDLADVPGSPPPEPAAGYELMRWTGPCPPELRDLLVTLRSTMNDAPVDDLDWEDEVWDVDRVKANERAYEQSRVRSYTVAARDIENGDLAAFTEVHVDGDGPWANQEDTAVARPHRGHGLGLVVKSVMYDWLREREPSVRKISTWNAASNTHMRAINERLGFRELDRWHAWQLRL